jgi:hypothetical protein
MYYVEYDNGEYVVLQGEQEVSRVACEETACTIANNLNNYEA